MADERWRGALEGYLNNQKYYLLVEPGRYQDALNIYDRLKQEAEYRAFGLVDIGKLREKETLRPLPGSLAEKVETENKLARSYADYLLGRVICCDTAEQLRCYKTAITAKRLPDTKKRSRRHGKRNGAIQNDFAAKLKSNIDQIARPICTI